MAYKPSLKDLQLDEDEISSKSYRPSLRDLPLDEDESLSNKSASQILLEKSQRAQGRRPNLLDSLIAPEARQGIKDFAGMTAAMAVPEMKIPGVSQLLSKGIEGLSPVPRMMANYLRNIGKTAAGGAASNVIMSDEDPLSAASTGGKTGALISALTQPLAAIMPGANPIIRGLIGGGLGSLAGSQVGTMMGYPHLGEIAGGALGAGLGFGKGLPALAAKNLLSKANPEEVLSREAAAKSIGVPLTMTEAIGTPLAGKQMASLYKDPDSALRLYEFGETRKPLEEKAIKSLMSEISPQDAYINIEKPLYDKAMQTTVPMDKFSSIIKDPYMKKQLDKVVSDPLYAEELKSAEPNSIKVLDLLKRSLDSENENATKSESRLITSKLNNLKSIMDEISPDYRLARQVAEKRITRENVERKMNDAELSGSNFYDKFLKNNDQYKKLYFSLRDPENPNIQSSSQKKLEAMKTTFPLLIEPMNAKIASTVAESKSPFFGKFVDQIHDLLTNSLMKNYNKNIMDMITSDKFDNQFKKLYKIKDKEEQARFLAKTLGKGVTFGINKYGANENQQ